MLPAELVPVLGARGHVEFYNYVIAQIREAGTADQFRKLIAVLREREVLEFIARNHRGLSPLANALLQGLCEKVFTQDRLRLSAEFLALPPMFEWLGWRTSRSHDLEKLRERVLGQLDAKDVDARRRFRLCLLLLLFDGFLDGCQAAIRQLVVRIVASPTWIPSGIGSRLQLMGWYSDEFAGLGKFALDQLKAVDRPELDAIDMSLGVLEALGLSKLASHQWNTMVREELVQPLMLDALASGRHNLALQLEQRLFRAVLRQVETNEHLAECTTSWAEEMNAAGRSLRRKGPATVSGRDCGGPPKIGFLLMSASTLAHAEGLLGLLQGAGRLRTAPFEAVVYVFTGRDATLRRQLQELRVPAVFLDDEMRAPRLDWVARLEWLRDDIGARGLHALTYVSYPGTMLFAFGMRIAPVQVWWSMKYHQLGCQDIDGYIASGSLQERWRTIGGRSWRTVPGSIATLVSPAQLTAAAATRKSIDAGILLGSIVRPEKLNNDAFMGALARILRANPAARFLWFGQDQPPELAGRMRKLGLLEQCIFQGWVDTRLYAGVLDIHLDTFPFPAGITMVQSMAAGVPGVTLETPESRQNGVLAMLGGMLDGTTGSSAMQRRVRDAVTDGDGSMLLFCARSVDEYVAMVQRLIDDPGLRARAGRAAARVPRVLIDPRRTAEMFGDHLREIIEQKEGKERARASHDRGDRSAAAAS